MPPLPSLSPVMSPSMVPVVQRPPSSSPAKMAKGKRPVRHPPRRQYDDGPLPIKPSSTAPKNAHIINREQDFDGAIVRYQLKIGDVEINDVGVDEILDYVSALELEQFENAKFREEAEILKVIEEDLERERRAKLDRAAERARTKGTVMVDEASDAVELAGESAESDGAEQLQTGRHGRARPDYSKFYLKPGGKGEQISGDFANEPTRDDVRAGPARPSVSPQELPKRRRRKRDPVTGELMPLAPLTQPDEDSEKEVRRRRKRHPLTGELMPIGWRFDPEAEGEAYERRREGHGSSLKDSTFKRLSISEQHNAKRPRLDTENAESRSASPIPSKAEIMGRASAQQTPKGLFKKSTAVVELMSSDEEAEAVVAVPSSSTKQRPRQAGNSMITGTAPSTGTTSATESPPDPVATTSIMHPTASPSASQRTPRVAQPVTSILSPSAPRMSSADPLAAHFEEESSDDEVDEDEWFIESILGHRMSDPDTHPPDFGNKEPVMLYSVKWVDYDEPTWEPVDSFGDRSFVDAYRRKVGLEALPTDDEDEVAVEPRSAATKSTATSTSGNVEMQHGGDEAEYEVEKIVAHHLSDPRTHPEELGKKPVMLFQVKWKGFKEMTWEPEDSFNDDVEILRRYKRTQRMD